MANPTARRLFRWEGRNFEGQELVEELLDLLAIEVHAPDALLLNGADSEDLRCNVGEPARTLRIVMQAVATPAVNRLGSPSLCRISPAKGS